MSELYNIYLKSIFSLSRSIVLKSEATIEAMNYIDSFRGPISENPAEWRYYKNMAGEYHINDEPMYVISADTKEEILFDKQVLASHPLSRLEYSRIGNLREGLITRYPDYEELIDRILDPIDIQSVIDAKDFEIVYFDKNYLDSNEHELMSDLQEWIYNFTHRWNIPEMGITDPLYPALFIGILYIYMTVEIVNLRLSKVFTLEACQWHVWQHLSSTLGLGEFKEALDVDSSIYLYKNINYIKDNLGKESILHILDKKLLKPLGLVAERIDLVRHEAYDTNVTYISSVFNKVRLDDPGRDVSAGTMLTARDVVKKTAYLATGNFAKEEANIADLEFGADNSLSNTKNTNIVMVSEVPNAYSVFTDKEQLRLDYWIYLSCLNRFNSTMAVSVPGRGVLTLSPLSTFILLLYSSVKAYREPGVKIPLIGLQKVISETPYDYDYILNGTREEDLDTVKLRELYELVDLELVNVNSSQDLFEYVEKLSSMNFSHMTGKTLVKTVNGQGQFEETINKHYIGYDAQLTTEGYTFDNWINSIDLVTVGLTDSDWLAVAESCLFEGTGVHDKEVGLSARHSNMVKLLDALTSYGLSVIPGESFSTASLTEYADTVQSNIRVASNIDINIALIGNEVNDVKSTGDIELVIKTASTASSILSDGNIDLEVSLGLKSDSLCSHLIDVYTPLMGIETKLTITENI